jgi:hypothetical protein
MRSTARSARPVRKWGVDNTHAGFQASKLFSPSPEGQAQRHRREVAGGQGRPGQGTGLVEHPDGPAAPADGGKALAVDVLLARREVWPARCRRARRCSRRRRRAGLPGRARDGGLGRRRGVLVGRLHVIEGEFSEPARPAPRSTPTCCEAWTARDGRGFEVMAACIDSGGHHTQHVYDFAKARLGRRVWAIKGASERDGQRNPVWPTKRPNRARRRRSGR